MSVIKTSIRVEDSGLEVFEVRDADTNEIIGYDYVNPDSANEEISSFQE
jgi:hypothetical protein